MKFFFIGAYIQGSRYYETAECFLFFLRRFISDCDDPVIHSRFYPLLKERVTERIGAVGDGLALAMRLIVCDFTGVGNDIDLQTLRTFQCEDGGWDTGLIYKYGSSGLSIGNRGSDDGNGYPCHPVQPGRFVATTEFLMILVSINCFAVLDLVPSNCLSDSVRFPYILRRNYLYTYAVKPMITQNFVLRPVHIL